METIKIATFNVRNNSKRLFYCGVTKKGVDYAKILAHHINRTHIDIIGSQELVSGYIRRLKKMSSLLPFIDKHLTIQLLPSTNLANIFIEQREIILAF